MLSLLPDKLKDKATFILLSTTLLFVLLAAVSCNNARLQQIEKNKQAVKAFDLEERLSKTAKDGSLLTEQLQDAQKALAKEQAEHAATNKVLAQEQLMNQSLKEEIQKVTKAKDALERDLKQALISEKPERKK